MSDPLTNGPASGEMMMVSVDYVPRKKADILELDMGDGFIIYNHDSSLVHHLNPSASLIWQLCDGEATVAELAQDIADEYNLDPERMRQEVAGLVGELDTLGLLEDARATDQG